MKTTEKLKISRDKHLDHMVRVTPLLVFGYAAQSFVILKVAPGDFSTISLSILGGILALMITAFITYDLTHKVEFFEHEIKVSFLGSDQILRYEDIWSVEVSDEGGSFSNLSLIINGKKKSWYFIDQAVNIKLFIDQKKSVELLAA